MNLFVGDNSRQHLSLVSATKPDYDELEILVCSVRRDMARLLRALQASGRGISGLPDPITTRLAHVDSVTARYLISLDDDERAAASETTMMSRLNVTHIREPDEDIRAAAESMRDVERWILDNLTSAELGQIRSHEISVRVERDELTQPLVRTGWSGEDLNRDIESASEQLAENQRLRYGLATLDDSTLANLCLRLGIRTEPPPWGLQQGSKMSVHRLRAEQAVLQTLSDGHLLAILIATLPSEAHRLLAALIRGKMDEQTLRQLSMTSVQQASGDIDRHMGFEAETPVQQLRGCALAFYSKHEGRIWVPVELHRQIDGVLRAFGI